MKYLVPALFIFCLLLTACGTDEDTQTPSDTNTATDVSESPDESEESNESDGTTDNDSEETNEPDDTRDNDSAFPGSSPTSCGSPDQGLEPVDCTMHGDTNAQCVFSNHCYCSAEDGFECEEKFMDGDWEECAPGSTCVPVD